MYLKAIKGKGVTRLYFYESYYEKSAGTGGKVRQRMVESLGRLDDLEKVYDDPIAHFKQVAAQRTEAAKEEPKVVLEMDLSEQLNEQEHNLKNIGYCTLKQLYKDLEIDKFWNWKTRDLSVEYSIDQIFRLLVFSRVLYPDSKKRTFELKDRFFEIFEGFDLNALYYALDIIAKNQKALQKWIYDRSGNIVPRDCSVSYFDCTNYYFDIGSPDVDLLGNDGNPIDADGNPTNAKYRKRGPEKNRRPDPIVQMGLLLDRNGIPLAYDIFPGNESEKVHMRPIINRVKADFTNSRIIFVADRGLNTSDNIYWLNGDNKGDKNERDGYVYGQSIRGADAEFKEWVLQKEDYITEYLNAPYGTDTDEDTTEDGRIRFVHKSRVAVKELHVNVSKTSSNSKGKKTVRVDQKQMVYYSEKYARKQAHERAVMVERAKDLIQHPQKYDRVTCAGSASYVLNLSFSKSTGEIVDTGKALVLDTSKIAEEAQFDGYYSIVTSELIMSDTQMRDIYRGLIKIEHTFKITKSDLKTRPIYIRTNEHIDAHFSTCFTSLVILRLLQAKIGGLFPAEQIIEALRNCTCVKLDANRYMLLYHDKVIRACEDAFGIDLSTKYRTQQELRRLLRY